MGIHIPLQGVAGVRGHRKCIAQAQKWGSGEAQSLVMLAKPHEANRFEAFVCRKKGSKTLLSVCQEYLNMALAASKQMLPYIENWF